MFRERGDVELIARVRILLPTPLMIRHADALTPWEFAEAPYMISFYRPMQCLVDMSAFDALSPVPTVAALNQLEPAVPQTPTDYVRLDGSGVLVANMLQIDFRKPDFDRIREQVSPEQDFGQGDPSGQLIFDIANSLLARLRSVMSSSHVKPLDGMATPWRLEYLADDGQPLPMQPPLIRHVYGASWTWRLTPVTKAIWDAARVLPRDFRPHAWASLLLDSETLLPDIGAAIVVANAALEVFIAWSLDTLAARSAVPMKLWRWINERRSFWQEPSVPEQFDILLDTLAGHSLKGQSRLWEGFQNLRDARNSFNHEGIPRVGKRVLTLAEATELIVRAREIVDWVEGLLPEESRRRRQPRPRIDLRRPLA